MTISLVRFVRADKIEVLPLTFNKTRSLLNAVYFRPDNNVCARSVSSVSDSTSARKFVTGNGFSDSDLMYMYNAKT